MAPALAALLDALPPAAIAYAERLKVAYTEALEPLPPPACVPFASPSAAAAAAGAGLAPTPAPAATTVIGRLVASPVVPGALVIIDLDAACHDSTRSVNAGAAVALVAPPALLGPHAQGAPVVVWGTLARSARGRPAVVLYATQIVALGAPPASTPFLIEAHAPLSVAQAMLATDATRPSLPDPRPGAKRKRRASAKLAIFGRLVAKSPIHRWGAGTLSFFIELESGGVATCVIFAGPRPVRWYPFLALGASVLITNVRSKAMLQGTANERAVFAVSSTGGSVHAWDPNYAPPPLPGSAAKRLRSLSGRAVSPKAASQLPPPLLSRTACIAYRGVITAVAPEEASVMLDGAIRLLLSHHPTSALGLVLVVGSRIRACNVHVVLDPETSLFAGLGACSYSTIELVAPPPTAALTGSLVPPFRLASRAMALHFKTMTWLDYYLLFNKLAATLETAFHASLKRKHIRGSERASGIDIGLAHYLLKALGALSAKRNVTSEFLAHPGGCHLACFGSDDDARPQVAVPSQLDKARAPGGALVGFLVPYRGGLALRDDRALVPIVASDARSVVRSSSLGHLYLVTDFRVVDDDGSVTFVACALQNARCLLHERLFPLMRAIALPPPPPPLPSTATTLTPPQKPDPFSTNELVMAVPEATPAPYHTLIESVDGRRARTVPSGVLKPYLGAKVLCELTDGVEREWPGALLIYVVHVSPVMDGRCHAEVKLLPPPGALAPVTAGLLVLEPSALLHRPILHPRCLYYMFNVLATLPDGSRAMVRSLAQLLVALGGRVGASPATNLSAFSRKFQASRLGAVTTAAAGVFPVLTLSDNAVVESVGVIGDDEAAALGGNVPLVASEKVAAIVRALRAHDDAAEVPSSIGELALVTLPISAYRYPENYERVVSVEALVVAREASGEPAMTWCVTLRDTRAAHTLSWYVDTAQFGWIGGLVSGARVELSRVMCKISRSGNIYLVMAATTSVVVRGWVESETCDAAVEARLEPAFPLAQYYAVGTIMRRVVRIRGSITALSGLRLVWKCLGCGETLGIPGRCAAGCVRAPSKFFLDATVFVDDGSAEATVFVDGDLVWRVLGLSRRRGQMMAAMAKRHGALIFARQGTRLELVSKPEALADPREHELRQLARAANAPRVARQVWMAVRRVARARSDAAVTTTPDDLPPPLAGVLRFKTLLVDGVHAPTLALPRLYLKAVAVDEVDAAAHIEALLANLSLGTETAEKALVQLLEERPERPIHALAQAFAAMAAAEEKAADGLAPVVEPLRPVARARVMDAVAAACAAPERWEVAAAAEVGEDLDDGEVDGLSGAGLGILLRHLPFAVPEAGRAAVDGVVAARADELVSFREATAGAEVLAVMEAMATEAGALFDACDVSGAGALPRNMARSLLNDAGAPFDAIPADGGADGLVSRREFVAAMIALAPRS
ncbi:uncharacterized protein AMSG_06170 [Thecamonas trahens ATCC 50062]|uniref:CST complex subunit CTC1 n=1 Tax=Thecamonas trahens ATCC 50062 TaxID=461836 RepID=A0A0L0DCM6_THETB|nr:hypothetical protein AMSG_06170 [Thecamonas trahens ATCC 50062]KNC49876.1 hypothetical protein AMSG_06170 [Thecamonas trahens ATCC 50062]|eukprot:XP_013757360.1 hypothetical protein AMSG_06170 [Thecamonas trahens ATCC 50062]